MAATITKQDLERLIEKTVYTRHAPNVDHSAKMNQTLGQTTFCTIYLKNGLPISGKSECFYPSTFDKEEGERRAREDALKQLYPIVAYLVKQAQYLDSMSEEVFLENVAIDLINYSSKTGISREELSKTRSAKLAATICPQTRVLLDIL